MHGYMGTWVHVSKLQTPTCGTGYPHMEGRISQESFFFVLSPWISHRSKDWYSRQQSDMFYLLVYYYILATKSPMRGTNHDGTRTRQTSNVYSQLNNVASVATTKDVKRKDGVAIAGAEDSSVRNGISTLAGVLAQVV